MIRGTTVPNKKPRTMLCSIRAVASPMRLHLGFIHSFCHGYVRRGTLTARATRLECFRADFAKDREEAIVVGAQQMRE